MPNVYYISGPISGLKRDVYRKAFENAEEYLQTRGHLVINPTNLEPSEGCGCKPERIEVGSHVSVLPPEHKWGCYLRRDLAEMLLYADSILMLDGWENSHGARLEFNVAVAVGMKAFRLLGLPSNPLNASVGYRMVPMT